MTLRTLVLALSSAWMLAAPAASHAAAPKPLYRDPVTDGAADVSIVFDKARREWVMFYTSRRATLKSPDPKDVAWVHATPIGTATSKDGMAWTYTGVAKIPPNAPARPCGLPSSTRRAASITCG